MQINLFAEETQLQRLSELGDSLEKLNVIDFESFRPLLEKVNCKERKSKAGRPSYDVVMMFKILVLQRLFNLSDDQTIGIKRAGFNISLTNLVYNFCRYTILKRKEVYMG